MLVDQQADEHGEALNARNTQERLHRWFYSR